MSKTIQLVQIDPQELVGLIYESVKNLFNDFKNRLSEDSEDELLTPSQVCELFKIDSSTLWRWAGKGIVVPYGIGNRRYYKKKELLDCVIPLKNPFKITRNNLNEVA